MDVLLSLKVFFFRFLSFFNLFFIETHGYPRGSESLRGTVIRDVDGDEDGDGGQNPKRGWHMGD